MPVRAYCRLRINGSLPNGEVWSINPSFIGNFDESPPSTAALQTWATNASDFLEDDCPAPMLGLLSQAGSIVSVRAEYYDTTGKLGNYAEQALSAPKAGAGDVTKPITTALVCSLYTGLPGRSYRGRLYWPALGIGLDVTNGRVVAADVTTYRDAFNTMLVGLQSSAPSVPALVLGVYSKTRGSGTAVSQLRVGDILDQWRGRRDALIEAYSIAPYTG